MHNALLVFYIKTMIPYRFWDGWKCTHLGPQIPHEVEQPYICQPITLFLYSSSQDCYALFVDHIKRVILSWARLFVVRNNQVPFFEFNVQVLACFPKYIDKGQIIIHYTILVFSTEAENTLHFDLISKTGFQLISMHYLMMSNFLIGLCLVLNRENEGIYNIASCERYEVKLLTVLLLFVDASANHESGTEEGGCVMFETDSASSSQPFSSLKVINQEISIEPFTFLPFKAHSSNNDQIISIDFNCMEARRQLWALALTFGLYPFPTFPIIFMKQPQSFQTLLMISAKQIYLFFIAKEGCIVSYGWKQRVKATIKKRSQLNAHVKVPSLVPFYRRCFNHQFPFFFCLFKFRDLFLQEFFFIQSNLAVEVPDKGGVELAMISIDSCFHLGLMNFHFFDDRRQAFDSLVWFSSINMMGVQGLFEGMKVAQRGGFSEQFRD